MLVPFIPKRGEKDFEPLPASDAFPPSSKEATLSEHQKNLLQNSRNALYTALSSGSRHHSSRGHNSFTWRPELDGGRATCDAGNAAYGIHFGNIGFFHQKRRQLELLPEEALYMVERGAVELWREEEVGSRVPMSVQQAWDEVIGHDEMTPERYQVRLVLAALSCPAHVLFPGLCIPATTRLRRCSGTPCAWSRATECRQACSRVPALHRLPRLLYPSHPRPCPTPRLVRPSHASTVTYDGQADTADRDTRRGCARRQAGEPGCWPAVDDLWCATGPSGSSEAPLTSGARIADQIFSRLAIIPSGHDRPLSRGPLPHTPSVFTPLSPVPDNCKPKDLPPLEQYPYQPFFHIYKPVTKYKKSDPPEPDFKMVVIKCVVTSCVPVLLAHIHCPQRRDNAHARPIRVHRHVWFCTLPSRTFGRTRIQRRPFRVRPAPSS